MHTFETWLMLLRRRNSGQRLDHWKFILFRHTMKQWYQSLVMLCNPLLQDQFNEYQSKIRKSSLFSPELTERLLRKYIFTYIIFIMIQRFQIAGNLKPKSSTMVSLMYSLYNILKSVFCLFHSHREELWPGVEFICHRVIFCGDKNCFRKWKFYELQSACSLSYYGIIPWNFCVKWLLPLHSLFLFYFSCEKSLSWFHSDLF